MGSFVFVVLVLGFIWIVRGLTAAEQRRQQARQAGFTEEEIHQIDQKNLAIQTFLAGLIVGPATFIGMFLLTCLLIWVLFPVGLLATLALWSFYLKWLRSFYRGE
jgi:ABC-type microcin C transport system permease subunit YejB